jgi:3-hydroxybutyryl-CoA dehydrogenase
MNIIVIGEQQHADECSAKFGATHEYTLISDHHEVDGFLRNSNLVFDFTIDEEPEKFDVYQHKHTTAFINTSKISLHELVQPYGDKISATLFGFNGLPTFLNRPLLEVCLHKKENERVLQEICKNLSTDFIMVDDRVGLVTPRVICMIINEAYYTVQEGTATRGDIDRAMKLGTNYPFGPFEWCQRIGITHVYELLQAVYDDTKDERYKISPLLKKEYLQS